MNPLQSQLLHLSIARAPVKDVSSAQVVALDGEIDLDTVAQLRKEFRSLQDDGVSEIVLDIENVGYIDSIGLSTLADASRKFRGAGGWLRLVSTNQNLRRLLDITGLIRFLPLFADVESALAA
jgi:anti-sigma B factor antagonist